METVDLETEGIGLDRGHNFVSSGLVVSNSHCVSYALIAYRQLWLKAHYPTEFFCALLAHCGANKDDVVADYVMAAGRLGVRVVGPDVNASGVNPEISPDGSVVMGLSQVKFCGDRPVRDVVARRPAAGYASISEFQAVHASGARSSVNRKVAEALLRSGAMDGILGGAGRADALSEFLAGRDGERERFGPLDMAEMEAEYTGFVFRPTPLNNPDLFSKGGITPLDASGRAIGPQKYFGLVASVTEREAKNGKPYHIVDLTDLRSTVSFFCWQEAGIGKMNVTEGDGLVIVAKRGDRGMSTVGVQRHYAGMRGKLNAK